MYTANLLFIISFALHVSFFFFLTHVAVIRENVWISTCFMLSLRESVSFGGGEIPCWVHLGKYWVMMAFLISIDMGQGAGLEGTSRIPKIQIQITHSLSHVLQRQHLCA